MAPRTSPKPANSPITICFPFTGDAVGGSHISALGLIRNLDRQHFRVIILPQKVDGAISKLFQDNDIPVEQSMSQVQLPYASTIGPRHLLRTVKDILPQINFLRSNGVDVVHTNDGGTHAAWAVPARLSGAKLLWHHRSGPTARGLRFVAPLLANRVLSVSEFALPRRGWFSAARKAEVLHSPFDTNVSQDRAAARAALLQDIGAPEDAVLIGYFGSFIERKRPLLFMDVIARLQDRIRDRPVYGLMFGEALDADMNGQVTRHVASLDIGSNLQMMGWRTPGTFWIAACDQLLVPAVAEPFGRTLIEAMLVGTPIVATRSGGNVEALRDGVLGLLAAPDDAEELAEACASLIQDPDAAATFARKAQLDARRRFGERNHAARVEQVYAELVGSNRP